MLTPSIARSVFRLIGHANSFCLTLDSLTRQFPHLHGVDTSESVKLAQVIGWIDILSDTTLRITPKGHAAYAVSDPILRLRLVLSDYIRTVRPAWARSAQFGRRRLLNYLHEDTLQLFLEADLGNGHDPGVLSFWDSIASDYRNIQNQRQLEIGRRGESKTLEFELKRTGYHPIYAAIEDDSDGFDVISRVSESDSSPLTIEVKASTSGLDGFLFLTRNEWQSALSSDTHCFHLWEISQITRLAILSPRAVAPHVPLDQSEGEWQSVKIPFRLFKDQFFTLE